MKKLFKNGEMFLLTPQAYGGYESDGLVFQLDCKKELMHYQEEGLDIYTLQDIVSNSPLIQFRNDEIVEEIEYGDNGGICLNEDPLMLMGSVNPSPSYVEICFRQVKEMESTDTSEGLGGIVACVGTKILIIRNYYYTPSGSSISTLNKHTEFYSNEHSTLFDESIEDEDLWNLLTFAVSESIAQKNGEDLTLTTQSGPSITSSTFAVSGYGEFELFSIRAYNRVLTENERNNNYEIDKSRFKIYAFGGYEFEGLEAQFDSEQTGGAQNTISTDTFQVDGVIKEVTAWIDLLTKYNFRPTTLYFDAKSQDTTDGIDTVGITRYGTGSNLKNMWIEWCYLNDDGEFCSTIEFGDISSIWGGEGWTQLGDKSKLYAVRCYNGDLTEERANEIHTKNAAIDQTRFNN